MVAQLVLIRHGESIGNIAASAADAASAETIDVPMRDADVPLSPTGLEQARGLGLGLKQLPAAMVPEAIWCSPYRRAIETAQVALEVAGLQPPITIDERLRDRDLGIMDLLTSHGVRNRLSEEDARRRWLGKFYYRPPGGESWTDLALRFRSLLVDLDRRESGKRVMVFTHDAVVLTCRYVCEGLTEQEVLDIGIKNPVANTSYTALVPSDGGGLWSAVTYNDVSHLDLVDIEKTRHPEDPHVKQ